MQFVFLLVLFCNKSHSRTSKIKLPKTTTIFRKLWNLITCISNDDTSAESGINGLVILTSKLSLRLTGLPYLADRATRLGGSPHLSCKRDQNKIKNYMERRVTPHTRVTSPTWGPPPPCKQALNDVVDTWYEIFNSIIDEHLPLKQKRVKRKVQPK